MPSSKISVYTDQEDSEGPRINCPTWSSIGNWGNRDVILYNATEYDDEPPESDRSLPEHNPEMKASIQTVIDRSVGSQQETAVDAQTTQLQSAAVSSGVHRSSRCWDHHDHLLCINMVKDKAIHPMCMFKLHQ